MIFITLKTKPSYQKTYFTKINLIQLKPKIKNIYIYKSIKVSAQNFHKIYQNQNFKVDISSSFKLIIQKELPLTFFEYNMEIEIKKLNIKSIQLYTMNNQKIICTLKNLNTFLKTNKTKKYILNIEYYRSVKRSDILHFKQISTDVFEITNLQLEENIYVI